MPLPRRPDQWVVEQPSPFNEYVAHLGDEAGAQQRFQQGGRPYLAHRQQRPTWLSWQGTPTSALWVSMG